MADTRKDRRAPVSLKVRFKSATVDEFIEQYSKDVSRGGIFIKSSQPMAVGTLLKFQFQLKDESALIRGVGRVVWTRSEEDAGAERPAGMGIKFIKMDGDSKGLVERVLSAQGDSPGSYESGRESATTAEPDSLRPPAEPGPGSFFPDTTPMSEMPLPEDRTAVRHAAQFLASALSGAGSDEAATREAEQKAEEARKRTQQIEAQRAAEAERRKKASAQGDALPSMIIDPSLSLEPPPPSASMQPTETGLTPVSLPPSNAPSSDVPTAASPRPSKPPAAQKPSTPPKKSNSNPPGKRNSKPPPGKRNSKPPPKGASSKPPAAAVAKPAAVAAKPSIPQPEDDTSVTDRKKVLPAAGGSLPNVMPAKRTNFVPYVVVAAVVALAAFLALRDGPSEESAATVTEEPSAPTPAPVAPPPEPAEAPTPAPTEPAEPTAEAPTPAPVEPAAPSVEPKPSVAPAKIGRLRIVTEPAGATIVIGDKPRGKSPLTVDLPVGISEKIIARLPGYAEASVDATPQASLVTTKLALSAYKYLLRVQTTPPGANVSAGGKRGVSPADIELVAPPKGPLVVQASLPGYQNAVSKVTPDEFALEGGSMHATVTLRLEPPLPKPKPKPAEPKPAEPKDDEPKPDAPKADEPKPAEPKPAEPAPEPAPAAPIPDNPFG